MGWNVFEAAWPRKRGAGVEWERETRKWKMTKRQSRRDGCGTMDRSGQPRRGDELRDAVSVRNVPRINANLRVRPMPRYTIPS